MESNSIYRVNREDYKAFMEQLKPECREVKKIDLHSRIITKVFSKNTNECLCSRVTYREEGKPEQYYIFKMPLDEERNAPVPHVKLELKTKEEVQAVFDAFSKMRKEREAQND